MLKKSRLVLKRLRFGLVIGVCISSSCAVASNLEAATVTQLRCENLIDPQGIDVARPRLSWILESDRANEKQTGYEIVVDGQWDSGRVTSGQSSQVKYGGEDLIPAKRYTWKVRVWDAEGNASDWSPPATFSTGLKDWSARWIGYEPSGIAESPFGAAQWVWYPEGNPVVDAPVGTRYFRRTITIPPGRKLTHATGVMTGDNTCGLSVNGQKAGESDDFTKPAILDVAPLLHSGDNLLEITATNVAGNVPNPAGLIAKLHLEFETGDPIEVITDRKWEATINRGSWTGVKVLGNFGMEPWGQLDEQDSRRAPARYLRREFNVTKKITRATAYVCGLGFFNLFLNGAKISDDVMDPALSDYAKTDYYVTFDVTNQLRTGANAMGVVLGNGRFFAPRKIEPMTTSDFGHPKLRMELEIEYGDGTGSTVVSDENWRVTSNGPIRSDNEYDGEEYDARMEMPGWNLPGFNDSQWMPAQLVAAPGGVLKSQMIQPMRVTQVIHPIGISNPSPGIYIVDMGQNFYGTVKLKANGPAGARVQMISAYSLQPDGTLKTADNRSARSTDVYTFKGGGEEVWNPEFKGQGFRRVQVTGFPGTPTIDNFEGLVIHTDAEPVGEFQCSNDLINRIHRMMWWGMGAYLRSAPIDPDRDERMPWTGDPAKDAESEAYNWNVEPFYAKWMDDVESSQRPDGSLPDVSMYWDMNAGVEWPSVFTIIPDWYIDFYGDREVAEKHYAAMKTWVLAMQKKYQQPDGTLPETSYGDWCDTSTMDGKVSDKGLTPRDLISTAYQYNNCRIVARLARLQGQAEDERTFADMADKLKTAFNRKFLDPATHIYTGGTQCGYVLALAFGLVPDDQRRAVIANLVNDIMVTHQGHLTVGLIGMQWLMQTLTQVGRPDVAWTIATQTTRPSWGYMLSKGATTVWERWDCDTRDPGMNSEALLIQAGNLDAWFYQTLAGINDDPAQPAFKHILIKPSIVGDLTWVKAHFDSPYGRIVSNWRIEGKLFTLDVTIPPNTTATVIMPGTQGTHDETGSGEYHFTKTLNR